jgi:hypothetical protein
MMLNSGFIFLFILNYYFCITQLLLGILIIAGSYSFISRLIVIH